MATENEIKETLMDAAKAHHDYELEILKEEDKQWAGWYAAYVLGRFKGLATASNLTNLLEDAKKTHDKCTTDTEWPDWYARYISEKLELGGKSKEAGEGQDAQTSEEPKETKETSQTQPIAQTTQPKEE